ncbi:MAG: hypothetical protein ACK47N_12315 [Microcystis sp.]|jgi:hypothetical protein|uniref:hypothetical protein n=1 Tax=Microcystis TaxID=1125 RepID=UPI000E39309E|nr:MULTISPECIES: hypothetical protein [Microcystis]MBD2291439.1 hypothetical protein [Microcystis wesenbergii FACHB-1317]REJ46356.1 MAG: hypothetical protein DWQ58_21410 [Microcystis aeruginosa TA09]UZO75475.1 hypothetical protein M8120_22335 [Microcystis aeruginosa str. Chao 1910]
MAKKESCDWIMRVDLHLPTPDEMPDEMLEIAAAIAWVNYRVEGPGCLWLMVNSCCEPKFMYLPDIKLRRIAERAHPEVDIYDPINELLLLVSPNWEIFPGELVGDNETNFYYRINVKERVGKSCEDCWEVWGEKLGEVGREGMVKVVEYV